MYKILFILLLLLYNSCFCQIKIKAVGDIMPGSVTPNKRLPAQGGREFINSIAGELKGADILFGNLEGAFIYDGLKPQKCREESRQNKTCFEFGVPVDLAPVIRELGFNLLNLDNNHIDDYGFEAYEFTQHVLKQNNINYLSLKGAAQFNIKGSRVAAVAFGFSESSFNLSDLKKVRMVVSSLKTAFDVVIVSFHGGAEGSKAMKVEDKKEIFLDEDRGNVVQFAHTAIDAGASLVLGHGPHVLRGLELYKNKMIAYSMGNFLTHGNFSISGFAGVSGIFEFELDPKTGDFLRGRIIPTKQKPPGIPYRDNKNTAVKILRDLTNEINPNTITITESGEIIKKTGT